MVFESVAAEMLNRFLCKYIENVDESQLKIGIWGGDVILENLLLKEDALDELDLPIRTTYGELGKLVLKIPWKNLYTAPVLICVEQLFLLAVPNRDIKYDPVKEEQLLQSAKEYELQEFGEMKRRLRGRDQPDLNDTFTEKLLAQVIKNVQIKVKDLHIRYEDRVAHVEKPFSLGITLASFYVCTTDTNWEETIIQENVSKVNKIFAIESLAVYWNCNCECFKEKCLKEKKTMLMEFQETVCTKDHQPEGYNYILEPINVSTRMLMNLKPEVDDYKFPEFDIVMEMNTLTLGIDKLQYRDLIRLGESFSRMAVSARYRKYRPYVNVYRGHYSTWWRFAYVCVLEEQIRRVRINWSWEHMHRHRQRCHAYADAYAKKIMAVKPTKELETKLKNMEKDLDVFNILLIRERVEIEVEKAGLLNSVPEKAEGWFTRLGSFLKCSSAAVEDEDSASVLNSLEHAMTPEEKKKLHNAIDYRERSGSVHYPTSFIDLRVKFNLDTFQIQIKDTGVVTFRVVHLAFSKVSMDLERRPFRNGIKTNASIFRLSMYGLKQGNVTPLLVMTKNVNKDENLLDLQFELNPLDHTCDQRILVFLRSLQIVLDSKTVQRVFHEFKAPFGTSTLHKLQAHLENVKDMSAVGLQHAIEQHASLELKVDVQAPYIIVPYSGFYTNNEDTLILNLGRFTISSFPRNSTPKSVHALVTKGLSDDRILWNMISQSYDKFFLNLENIQILIALKGEDWLGVLERNQVTPLHLLEPLCFVFVFNNCLIRDDPKLVKAKLTATVSNVAINVTNLRLLHLLAILSSIPSLDIDEEESEPVPLVDAPPQVTTGVYLMQAYWDAQGERKKKEEFKREVQGSSAINKIQPIVMHLTFQLECIRVKGFLVESASLTFETTKRFLTLEMIKIEVELVKKTFDMDLVAKLGGIFMDVYDVKRAVRVINTPMTADVSDTEYFVIFSYTQVDKQSPELYGKYNNTLNFIQIHFSMLTLIVHQEVLLTFADVIYNFQIDLEVAVIEAKGPDKVAPTTKYQFKDVQRMVVERIRETKLSAIFEPKTKQKRQSKYETRLRMKVDIRQIKISITTRTTLIVDIIVAGCDVNITVLKSLTKLHLRLGKIQVLDCYPKSHHCQIISVVGDETLKMEIIKYNVCKIFAYDREKNPDMALTAKLSCIRFIYLNRFISSLLTFYNNVQVVQILFTATTSGVTPPGKETMKKVVNDADFINISADIETPIVIIPISSLSMEALMLHLGYITISNECHILPAVNENGVAPAIDCIQFKFKHIKANRVKLNEDYRVVNEVVILDPFDFEVEIERNLSLSGHKHVPDCEITVRVPELCFTITEEDCKMAMEMMNQNFSDVEEVEVTDMEYSMEKTYYPIRPKEFDSETVLITDTTCTEPSRIALKINLIVEAIIISLFTGGAKTLDDTAETHSKADLAIFALQSLYLGSLVFSSGNQRFTFRLGNCYLDDVRLVRGQNHTRLVQLKDDPLLQNDHTVNGINPQEDTSSSYLMAITYFKKDDDTFIDVKVHSIQVIVGLDYVMELREFFFLYRNADEVIDMERPEEEARKVRFTGSSFAMSVMSLTRSGRHVDKDQTSDTNMTVNVKMDPPYIIFVESIDNTDSNALFINGTIIARVQFVSEKMILNAFVKSLQFYVCCYDPARRKHTKNMILRPCAISCVVFASGEGNFNIDICIAAIKIDLSPGTIDLFWKIYCAMFGNDIDHIAADGNKADYSELWKPKQFSNCDFWFLNKRSSRMFIKSSCIHPMLGSSQICTVSVPSVVITAEAGNGKQRQQLLLLELKLECIVYDWSTNLFMNTNLALQVAYYNTSLALWEPLVEPVERDVNGKPSHHLWELKVVLKLNQRSSFTKLSRSSIEDEDLSQSASLSISISSSEKLELTLTKTGIEVLTNLSTVILETNKFDASFGVSAPYVVRNMSGMPVTVIFHDGAFRLMADDDLSGDHQVTLESGAQLELCLQEDQEDGAEIAGINLARQTHNSKRFLCVRVVIYAHYQVLSVPIFRADKRYFSLKYRGDGGIVWGLVSDVRICNGGTILTLRGIINVHNHMETPIHIQYYEEPGKDEFVSVGIVQPEDELLLPLHCIYTATNEFFFCINDYKTTSEPFNWRHLHKAHIIHKLLSCSTLESKQGDPFYINVVGISTPVIFENSPYYTPDSIVYDIHLHPAVMIKNLLPVDILVCLQSINGKEETIIQAGNHSHLVHAEPGQSKISVTLPSYYQQKWLIEGHIQWTTSKFDVLRFICGELNHEKSLQLQIHKRENNGTTCWQLYSQFWMVNKTGLSLSYRQLDQIENTWNHEKDLKEPLLFSFWGTSNTKKMLLIMISNGEWSDKVSLDAAGSSGVINCKVNGLLYQIGVYIHLSQSQLTQQVIFTPFYVLVNNHEKCIECQEVDRPHDPWISIVPGDCTPFWPHSAGHHKEIHLRIENSPETSIPFSYTSVHSTLVKVPRHGGVLVDVHKIDAAVYITFLPYMPGMAPTRLINHTDQPIRFYEQNEEDAETLNAREMVLFTWNKPTGARLITYQLRTKKDFIDDLKTDGVRELVSKSGETVYLASFMDGFQRVTLFTTNKHVARLAKVCSVIQPIDVEIAFSLQAVGISLVNNDTMKELLYVCVPNSDVIWETRTSKKRQFKPLDDNVSQLLEEAYNQFTFETSLGQETEKIIKIGEHFEVNLETKEVIHPPNRYLRRYYEDGVWFHVSLCRHQSRIHGKLNRLQMDNQLCDSVFPVLFAPVALPKTISANRKRKPFAEWCIVRQYTEHNTVKHYKYFKILVQEFHVKVDMNFLIELLAFLDLDVDLSEHEEEQQFYHELKLAIQSLRHNVYTTSLREEKNYYELLHFSPLKIHISFSLSAKDRNLGAEESPNIAILFLHGLGVTLTDVHDVVLRLRYFERKNTFSTFQQMYTEVFSHYTNEFLKNVYVLIFGLDLIGNPWGFLMGIGKGVQDLFYEPYLGAIQGAEEFRRGVFLGVVSLFGSAVGGVCGAVSRISGALGTGVAVLTFDRDFQRERKERLNKLAPSVPARLLQSSKGLVMGMVDGMSGVVVKPVSGANKEGMTGFFKGVGKGMAGLVTRPAVGVFDFVSGSLSVVAASKVVAQVRPPRYFNPDGLVRPYTRAQAEGNLVLQRVEKGRFTVTDTYVYHLTGVNGKKDVLLLTDKRIMYIQESSILGYTLEWQCTWDVLQPPHVNSDGEFVFSGHAKKRLLRLRTSSAMTEPIHIKSRQHRKVLSKHIKQLRETYSKLS